MVNDGVEFFVKINQQGIDSGAANWPIDFDPVWVEQCSGFECGQVSDMISLTWHQSMIILCVTTACYET